MKTVIFDSHGHNAPAYGCNIPGDQSGHYVMSEIAIELLEALEEIVNAGAWYPSAIEIDHGKDGHELLEKALLAIAKAAAGGKHDL